MRDLPPRLPTIAALTFDKNAGLTDPDQAPDAPAATVSELGDIWLLGRHRLVCGDCTDPLWSIRH